MKVIIADDSQTMRRIVQKMLAPLGAANVLEADGGDVVMALLKDHHDVGLILMDWNMPVMNGLECLRAIRKQESTKHIAVIMITTEVMRERIIEAIHSGATNYLRKPFETDKFNAVVGGILKQMEG